MKKIILPFLALLLISYAFVSKTDVVDLSIGDKAPKADLKMKGIDGEMQNLQALAGENGLLVVFSCNTCPFVIAWEDRYNDLHDLAAKNSIGMALINSNEAKRSGDDSMEEMKKHAKELAYKSPYLLDAKSELANAFGAKTTPHVFLFDSKMKLVYKGAIDDNHKSKDEASSHYLKDAIKKLSAGEKIDPNSTKALGCSIKRV